MNRKLWNQVTNPLVSALVCMSSISHTCKSQQLTDARKNTNTLLYYPTNTLYYPTNTLYNPTNTHYNPTVLPHKMTSCSSLGAQLPQLPWPSTLCAPSRWGALQQQQRQRQEQEQGQGQRTQPSPPTRIYLTNPFVRWRYASPPQRCGCG